MIDRDQVETIDAASKRISESVEQLARLGRTKAPATRELKYWRRLRALTLLFCGSGIGATVHNLIAHRDGFFWWNIITGTIALAFFFWTLKCDREDLS